MNTESQAGIIPAFAANMASLLPGPPWAVSQNIN